MSERILIIDDDPVERRRLERMVRELGHEAAVAASSDTVVAALADAYAPSIDAIMLDLTQSDLDAVGLLAKVRAAGLTIPIIVQTMDTRIEQVVAAMRAGATDFVVRPVGAERLWVSLRNALATHALEGELASIKSGAFAPRQSAEAPLVAAGGASAAPPLVPSAPADGVALPSAALALLDGSGNMRALEDIEADAIRFAITHYRGQMSEVARRLCIGRSTLYRKLDSLARHGEISAAEAPAL